MATEATQCRGVIPGKRKREPIIRPCKNTTHDHTGLCHACRLDETRIETILAVLAPDWASRIGGGPKSGSQGKVGRRTDWIGPDSMLGELAPEEPAPRVASPPKVKEGGASAPPSVPTNTSSVASPANPSKDYHTLSRENKAFMEAQHKHYQELLKGRKPKPKPTP